MVEAYVKDSRQIAKDAAGNWKDVDTNQNPYHGNINFNDSYDHDNG